MSKKRTNPNKTPETIAKNVSWMDLKKSEAYMNYPQKDDWRNRFIYTLFQWGEREDSLFIEDFCLAYKIPRRYIYRWSNAYEDIKEALEDIKIFIGSRRRKGALLNKFNYGAAYRDMHLYDPDWGPQVDKYHADLKIEDEKKNAGTKIVVVERYTPLEEVKE